MRHVNRICTRLHYGLFGVAVLATAFYGQANAAESNKIHVREVWYGESSQVKQCVPDIKFCEGKAKCEVPPKVYRCKTDAKPLDTQLSIIWDCGDNAHAAGHGAGPGTGKQTYTLTCPYIPNLNP